MEGCPLGDEVSSFVVGMEFRDSDEVGRRLLRLRSGKRENKSEVNSYMT
jgi:hypothetical protein